MSKTFRPVVVTSFLIGAIGFLLVNNRISLAQEKDKPVAATKWEYKQLSIAKESAKEIGEVLQKLGDEGWELTAVYREQVQNPFNQFVFKRPKR
jgi:hypothetical protein